MKDVTWSDDGINYWRINKDEALQLYDDFQELMKKYNVSHAALIVIKVKGDEEVNALNMTRGNESMSTILNVAKEVEASPRTLDKDEVIDENNQQSGFLNDILN